MLLRQSPVPLARLMHEVETAHVEAVDNAKYLAPLRKPLLRFVDNDEYTELPEKFKVCSFRACVLICGFVSLCHRLCA